MSETTLPVPLIEIPPTQAELPYDDGVPMESARHRAAMNLLIDALIPWLSQREDGFVGGNMFVYYSLAQLRNKDLKGPDFLWCWVSLKANAKVGWFGKKRKRRML